MSNTNKKFRYFDDGEICEIINTWYDDYGQKCVEVQTKHWGVCTECVGEDGEIIDVPNTNREQKDF